MMERYPPLLLCCLQLTALWIYAAYATARLQSAESVLLMVPAGVYLLFRAFWHYGKARAFSTAAFAALAVMPAVYYAEMTALGVSPLTLSGSLGAAAITHCVTVYNCFRYLLLIICAVMTVTDTVKILKD